MTDTSVYDADYFLRGAETGKSLYTDYRYLPLLSQPMCERIVEYCGITESDSILDFGCARGYVVRAFRELGYCAFGVDASKWAIENCDPAIENYVCNSQVGLKSAFREMDWIIAKDVLEHIPDDELSAIIDDLLTHARKGVFVVVPLSAKSGEPYVIPEYEQDITHVQRLTLGDWADKFRKPGHCVTARYLIPGIKQNWSHYPEGNGFILVRPEED